MGCSEVEGGEDDHGYVHSKGQGTFFGTSTQFSEKGEEQRVNKYSIDLKNSRYEAMRKVSE